MGNGTNESLGGAARQLRVGIECKDKADFREARQIPGLNRERVIRLSEHLVEIEQLASFSLPTHPRTFAGIVDAVAMKQIKPALQVVRILLVQTLDQTHGKIDASVLFARRLGGIRKVSQ